MKRLIEKLQSLQNANVNLAMQIAEMFVPKFFNKGLLLSTPDHSYPELYFIEDGLARGYFIHEGQEHTSWILEHGFILPTTSFFSFSQSIEYINFLKDSSGYALNLIQWNEHAKVNPKFSLILLEIYEENIQNVKQREQMLRIRHAETRFLHFRNLHPELINLPIHKILASLLAIESKYLFKIKRKYRKQ
ncbi:MULTISPECIES: Crp/Fnr family transcriptional regulator [Pedobacter]|uniref:Crp/Fnr family transcriptional regulator n=1 Tax=Pedobacter TaxID=84567 RepID=UPI00103CDB98|nr:MULTISPECIES: Crp/Fnr family transcriptional regulator [Pedobacter]MCX2575718.1 Crp/Fnr family transcriptional regulator [Pedobacter sandarakinus]